MTNLRRTLLFVDALGKWSGQIIAPLALIYMAIIMFEVVARYAFNSPTRWAHEISTFIFGAQFMLAGAYCYWRGSFVNVEILYNRLPERTRAIMDACLFLFPLAICSLMIWKGGIAFWGSLIQNEHSFTVFGPPLYPLRAIIPLSAFLLLTQIVAKFVRDFYFSIYGRKLK